MNTPLPICHHTFPVLSGEVYGTLSHASYLHELRHLFDLAWVKDLRQCLKADFLLHRFWCGQFVAQQFLVQGFLNQSFAWTAEFPPSPESKHS